MGTLKVSSVILLLSILSLSGVLSYVVHDNPDQATFVNQVVIPRDDPNPLRNPVKLLFLPDGRILIAEKAGRVRLVSSRGELAARPYLDITGLVNAGGDKGLLGLAYHPDFEQNHWIYVFYIADPIPGEPDEPADMPTQGIIARYKDMGETADPDSVEIILGTEPGDGTPSCATSHSIGDIKFGHDGTLFGSNGDGSHWEFIDDGTDRTPYAHMCREIFGAEGDTGAMRSQDDVTLGGKIFRLNPENGEGVGRDNMPGVDPNPFWDASAPRSARSRMWVKGLRNPYRFEIRPEILNDDGSPGVVYVADVGFGTYEEVHIVRSSGLSFGWPCLSGPNIPEREFSDPNQPLLGPFCAANMQETHLAADIFWDRSRTQPDGYQVGFTGNCAMDVAFYTGNAYPQQFIRGPNQRAVFFGDFGQQWIKVAWVDATDNVIPDLGVQMFAGPGMGQLTDMEINPATGELWYVDLRGTLNKFVYLLAGSENFPPIVNMRAIPNAINLRSEPIGVQFISDGTFDPEGATISFNWNFGDGSTSNDANPYHVYTTPASQYEVVLVVRDSSGKETEQRFILTANNEPPRVKIVQPADNHEFPMAEVMTTFRADATDLETPADQLRYQWEMRVVHDNHYHPDAYASTQREFSVNLERLVSDEERNILEVRCRVTDAQGLSSTDMIRVRPQGMTNVDPVARLRVVSPDDLSAVPAGTVVQVNGAESSDEDLDWLYFFYNWGDGISYYEEPHARHVYDRPGTYKISLSVFDVFNRSSTDEVEITITQPRTAEPHIEPIGGVKGSPVSVTIMSITPGATIHYTVDGSDPTTSSAVYSAPFTVDTTTTVKAIAVSSGRLTSKITTISYDFDSIIDEGLVGYWSFNGLTADGDYLRVNRSDVIDCSINGNDGSAIGNVAIATSGAISGQAVTIATADTISTESMIRVPYSPSISEIFSNGELSVAAHFNINSGMDRPMSIVSMRGESGTNAGFDLQVNPVQGWIRLYTRPGEDYCEATGQAITANQWHHIVVTVDDDECQIYFNGPAVNSDKTVSPLGSTGRPDLHFGNSGNTVLLGSIDEVYVYSKALAADEVGMLAGTRQLNTPLHVNFRESTISTQVGELSIITANVRYQCQRAPSTLEYAWTITGPESYEFRETYDNRQDVRLFLPKSTGDYAITLRITEPTSGESRNDTVSVRVTSAVLSSPRASPSSGHYVLGSTIEVKLSHTSDADIRYTLDGSEPTQESTRYVSPIIISETTTLKAKAFEGEQVSTTVTFTYTFADIERDLAIHYKFDEILESDGTRGVADSSANGVFGRVGGDPQIMEGMFGNAIEFMASPSSITYVNAGAGPSTDIAGELTVAAYVKIYAPESESYMKVISKKTSWDGTFGFEFEYQASTKKLTFLGSGADVATATADLGTDWKHIAAVVNGNQVRIYVDGQDVTVDGIASPVTSQLDKDLLIGTSSDTTPLGGAWTGLVDDLRVYRRALPAEELLVLVNGYCGDGYCSTKENCGICSIDCGCDNTTDPTGPNWGFENGLSGWEVQDIRNPWFPIEAVQNGVTTFDGFAVSRATEGEYSLMTGWDGCPAGDITIQREYEVEQSNCMMTFDYMAQYDLTKASQNRDFNVVIVPKEGCGQGFQISQTVLTATAGAANEVPMTQGRVSLGRFIGSKVTIIFQWTVPECYSGPAMFQLDNIKFEECSPEECIVEVPGDDESSALLTTPSFIIISIISFLAYLFN